MAERAVRSGVRFLTGQALSFVNGRTPLKKLDLTNMVSGEKLKVQFNPTTFTERLSVAYTRNKVRGLPHEPLDYENTSNPVVSMDFYTDESMRPGVIPLIATFRTPKIDEFRAFLISACYPPKGGRGPGLADAAPPRLLVRWPNVLVFTAVITDLAFEYQRFNWIDLSLVSYTSSVTFEEVRDFRMTMENARGLGATLRTFERDLIG
jgi:hypothetical protein